jgi:hypothetical protein
MLLLSYLPGCDIKVHASFGWISSPGFTAEHQYPPKLQCTISKLESGSQETTLLFKKFDTEQNYDLVQVHQLFILQNKKKMKLSEQKSTHTYRHYLIDWRF